MHELNQLPITERIIRYRKFDALNQSFLKDMDKDPLSVAAPDYQHKRSDGMIIGDITDLLAFSGEQAVHDKYIIEDDNLATGKVKDVIDYMFEYYGHNGRDSIDQNALVEEAAKEIGYHQNLTSVVRLRKIRDDGKGKAYWNHLHDVTGKTLVSKNIWDTAFKCYEDLMNSDEHIRKFFNLSESNYQQVYIEDVNGTLMKGLTDISIRGEHIIRDLKFSSFNPANFSYTYLKNKYYLQVLYGYLYAMEYNIPPHDLNFGFIVVNPQYKPVEITLDAQDLQRAMNGFKTKSGKRYKGVYELIEDYKFHIHHSHFTCPPEIFDGKMELNVDYELS